MKRRKVRVGQQETRRCHWLGGNDRRTSGPHVCYRFEKWAPG